MNISADLVGYLYLIWFPFYVFALHSLQKGSHYSSTHIIVGIVIYPFIVLTPFYLILLALFRKVRTVDKGTEH